MSDGSMGHWPRMAVKVQGAMHIEIAKVDVRSDRLEGGSIKPYSQTFNAAAMAISYLQGPPQRHGGNRLD